MAKPLSSAHQSWLAAANDPSTDFPLTHLPYAAFKVGKGQHLCVAIGTHLLDLYVCAEADLIPPTLKAACQSSTLNLLMSQGQRVWTQLRKTLTALLAISSPHQGRLEEALHSIAGATLLNPIHIPNFTDFYASIHHATRVGQLFRPDQPLLPNYKHLPIGYHGRASSIVTSETRITRPMGQTRSGVDDHTSNYLSTNSLDYELEVALYLGKANVLGEPIPIGDASQHIFGISLLNDWSARDIQSWEYQPLGPFLSKSFATSVSPWITPMAALEPFFLPFNPRSANDPPLLEYLQLPEKDRQISNVKLEVSIATEIMRDNKIPPFRLSESNLGDLYWAPAQFIAHHTSNGCNLQIGDLLATGTISGPEESSAGCLLELTRNGKQPIALPTGELRSFLSDGDEIILRGYCEAADHPRIGLGECRGTILPAHCL
jgi:fumarylacetoacetase